MNVSEPLDVGRTKWLMGMTNTFDPLQEIPPYLCALLEVTTPGTLILKAHITTNGGIIGPRCPSLTAVIGFNRLTATPFNPMDCVNSSTRSSSLTATPLNSSTPTNVTAPLNSSTQTNGTAPLNSSTPTNVTAPLNSSTPMTNVTAPPPTDNTAPSSLSSSESSGVPNSALGALAIIPIVIIAVAVYYLICVRRRKHAEGEPKVVDAEAPAKVADAEAPAKEESVPPTSTTSALVMRSPAFGVHHTQPASTD